MPLYGQLGYGSGGYGIADGGPVYAMPLSYYLNLLTSEYRLAPNLNKWLLAELTYFDSVSSLLSLMPEAFDPDTAIGAQLDVVGLNVGGPAASRIVAFQPSGGVSPVLDDDTYRLLIRATIANNLWDGTQTALYPLWAKLFPGGALRIIDNQNMSCTVILSGAFSSIAQDLITNGYIVPRPEGVEYTYIFSNLPVFGFSTENNGIIAGFDVGNWS